MTTPSADGPPGIMPGGPSPSGALAADLTEAGELPTSFPAGFFERDSFEVGPELIGCLLVSTVDGQRVVARLTEVEAYAGAADPASHAHRGPTRRTEVMFGRPGVLYRYLIYGMYWCLNVVAHREGQAGGVLMRAAQIVEGVDLARLRRPTVTDNRRLARGPAGLSRSLGWVDDGPGSGTDLLDPSSPARLLPGGLMAGERLVSGPRVGVSTAADRPWRFFLADEPSVSSYRRHRRADAGVPTTPAGEAG